MELLEKAAEPIRKAISDQERVAEPVQFNEGNVEYWTHCHFEDEDMPWYEKEKYEGVDLGEIVPLFKEWGDVVGIDVDPDLKTRWLFGQLCLGVEHGDGFETSSLFAQLPMMD